MIKEGAAVIDVGEFINLMLKITHAKFNDN